jgi:hypothetical protein
MVRFDRTLILLLASLIVGLSLWDAPPHACAQSPGKLRYKGQEGQTFAYDMKVTAETNDYIEEFKGVVSFKFNSVGEEQLNVTYQGGLNKTRKSKPKPQTGPRGFGPRFGPFGPGFGPRPPFGPFSSTPFKGTTTTTNVLTLTPRGRVQSMKGDSQLPYLLGNVSLLVFEPLPEEAEPSWTVNLGVSITEESEQEGPPFFGRFGPFGPFGQGQREERTAGSEVLTYNTERVDRATVVVNKTYRLTSPATGEDKESFEITGEGKWTFNRQLGVSESLDFKQKLIVREGNSTTTFPVSITYRRLSSQEWEKMEQERIAKAEKARAEREQKEAEKKAKAEAPIEGDERKEVLAALKSNNLPKLESTLKMLAGKTERTDEEIAQAINPLLNHPHASVRKNAKSALAKFSPEFKRINDLNRAYAHHRNKLSDLGPPVMDNTPLPPGLIVAARWHNRWSAAKVVQVLENGQVEVQFREWPWKEKRNRADIRLAPPEVEQPDVDPSLLAGIASAGTATTGMTPGAYRSWTDSTGTFTIEAKYVGTEGEKVRLLRKTDGKEVLVPLARLSEADRKFLEQARQADNPFEP